MLANKFKFTPNTIMLADKFKFTPNTIILDKKIKFTPNSIIIFGINLTLLANIILLCWVTNLIYSKYNYVS